MCSSSYDWDWKNPPVPSVTLIFLNRVRTELDPSTYNMVFPPDPSADVISSDLPTAKRFCSVVLGAIRFSKQLGCPPSLLLELCTKYSISECPVVSISLTDAEKRVLGHTSTMSPTKVVLVLALLNYLYVYHQRVFVKITSDIVISIDVRGSQTSSSSPSPTPSLTPSPSPESHHHQQQQQTSPQQILQAIFSIVKMPTPIFRKVARVLSRSSSVDELLDRLAAIRLLYD